MRTKEIVKTEENIIDNKEMRNKYSNRYDVLEKVKELLLIPNTEYATTQQVADFYEVNKEAIYKIAQRNEEELLSDGLINGKGKEIREKLELDIMSTKTFKGGFSVGKINFSNSGNKLFTRRAILRVGMLLRDSTVAREVRNQLLNIEEKTTVETKTEDIETEEALMTSVGMAVASGNATAVAIASSKLMAFKNRHIKQLENDNKALSDGILEWSDRSKLNFAVRKLASVSHVSFASVWNELYKQLTYKYGIELKKRGKSPYIQYIKEEEWKKVIKSFSAICKTYNVSPTEMFN